MRIKSGGAIVRLTTSESEHPRWIGIDYGTDNVTTECEVEFLSDGTIHVLDIRETPSHKAKDGTALHIERVDPRPSNGDDT